MVLVNNHIVGTAIYPKILDWVSINSSMIKEAPNYLAVVNMNGPSGAAWGFSLRHNDTTVWGNEGSANGCRFCYTQIVQIMPDDTVQEVSLMNPDKKNLSGSWTAKVIATDFGVIIVNGVVATGSYLRNDLGWFDISGKLYEGQDNIVTVAAWNNDGGYSWDFSMRKGETVVWGNTNSGSGQTGEVFFKTVIIDGAGNVIH